MDELCIVQISDTHVCPPGRLLKNKFDSNHALERAINQLNIEEYKIDCLLLSGDMVERGTQEEYSHLKQILKRLNQNIPVLFCLGNHDDMESFFQVFPNYFPDLLKESSAVILSCSDKESGLNYCIDFHVAKLIVLDSSIKETGWGEVSKTTLDWLEKILSDSATDTNILALHHPPVPSLSQVMDTIALKNPEDLQDLLLSYRNVRLIVCGHVHRTIFSSFAGIQVAFCPSVVFQYPIYMTGDRKTPTNEQPGFHVHKYVKEIGWSTHLRLIA